ncbi:MAG: hypothetical protein HIU81_14255 [Acidobacteria bacterium]|nr:hypothetical protein [Acidobacteriota bacterium]
MVKYATVREAIDASSGLVTALAFAPVRYSDMPSDLRRLQVSGTCLPSVPQPVIPGAPTVVLNGTLGMTTGKAAAQAAHAVMDWMINVLDANQQDAWMNDPLLNVRFDNDFTYPDDAAGPLIIDNGHTEIAPCSPTAYVA